MQQKLQERLEARRRRQRGLETAKIFAEEQNETEKRLMEELMNKYDVDGARAKEDAPDPYDHWLLRLLEKSPLFATIVDIDEILVKAKSLKNGTGLNANDDVNVFVDERDAQFVLEGKLSPVSLQGLNPAQVTVYQFGILLIRLLHRVLDTPNVKLLLADGLPNNNYTRNAFKNSVFYEHSSDTLFVRMQRAENVGDFMVVIIHSIAHLHAGDLSDDSEPQFLKYFYKVKKISLLILPSTCILPNFSSYAVPPCDRSSRPLLPRSHLSLGRLFEAEKGDQSRPSHAARRLASYI